MSKSSKNQGEGDRASANRYNRHTEEFARSGQVDKAAEEAKRAVRGKEKEQLRQAEESGRERAKEEDPQVKRDY